MRGIPTRAFALAITVLGLSIRSTTAADIFWVGYQNGCMVERPDNASFLHGDNWLNFLVPGATDTAVFGAPEDPNGNPGWSHIVHFGDFCVDVFACPNPFLIPAQGVTIANLQIRADAFTFDMGHGQTPGGTCPNTPIESGSLTVTGSTDVGIDSGTGTLTLREGKISTLILRIGTGNPGSNGECVVTGASSALLQPSSNSDSNIGGGPQNTGSLSLLDGAQAVFNGGSLFFGREGGHGTLTVSGGSTIIHGGVRDFFIGGGVRAAAPAIGTVTVTGMGSELDAQHSLFVGQGGGQGSVAVTEASVFVGSSLNIGANIGPNGERATGTMSIAGANAMVTGAGELNVGSFGGNGSLSISGGAQVAIAGRTSAGRDSNNGPTTGIITVSGTGTSLTLDHAFVGGFGGTGELNVNNAQVIVLGSGLNVGDNVDRNGQPGNGVLMIDGPTASVSVDTSDLRIGFFKGDGTLHASDGSSISVSDTTRVGDGGTGALELVSNAILSTDRIVVGGGAEGAGTMSVTNASVTTTGANDIGAAGGVGTVTISGATGQWTNQMSMTVGSGVGIVTSGSFTVRNGASLRSAFIRIGDNSGVGVLTVTDPGSSWTSTDLVIVATGGDGTIEILNGATVSHPNAQIAGFDNARGHVLVSGSGSEWSVAGNLTNLQSGTNSTAELEISDGGLVAAGSYTQNARGTLRVEVGPNMGQLIVSGQANLNGTLEIIPKGSLICGDSFDIVTAGQISGAFSQIIAPNLGVQILPDRVRVVFFDRVGDFDCSGAVDLGDFSFFAGGLGGPDGAVAPGSVLADQDADGDIDLLDFAAFQIAFGSP